MGRKRTFSDRRRGTRKDAFWGPERQSLSFPELDERSAARKKTRSETKLTTGPPKNAKKKRGVFAAIILVCTVVIALTIWFLFFVYPSPISGVSPEPKTHVKESNVDISVKFKRDIGEGRISLVVDGKDVTTKCSAKEKEITCKLALTDGSHDARVEYDGEGLMGKRSKSWSFTVDTSPPDLVISKSSVSDIEGSEEVAVNVSGDTEKGAAVKVGGQEVPVGEDGKFEGSATSTRYKSLEVTSTDAAGNSSRAYVVTQKPTEAKGIHVSVYLASSTSDLDELIDLVDRTELNALEIDLKDEYGQIAFEFDNELAQEINSVNDYIQLDSCVDRMRYHNIYTICRIVMFKDPKLAGERSGYAVQDKYGGLWGDGLWTDPYSKEVWDYNIAVAEAAAKAGFQEIQFDYVRFPSDGDTTTCSYPNMDGRSQGEVISEFLSYAREKLSKYNVFISADLFGLTASDQEEMNIGQNAKDIAERVDYICPMVYPSHYNAGEYGFKSPENNPGDIVAHSVEDFKEVIEGTKAKLRPWLQDFSLRVTYTPDMVRRQIDSTEKAGINEWLLWDPDCSYSEAALQPAEK